MHTYRRTCVLARASTPAPAHLKARPRSRHTPGTTLQNLGASSIATRLSGLSAAQAAAHPRRRDRNGSEPPPLASSRRRSRLTRSAEVLGALAWGNCDRSIDRSHARGRADHSHSRLRRRCSPHRPSRTHVAGPTTASTSVGHEIDDRSKEEGDSRLAFFRCSDLYERRKKGGGNARVAVGTGLSAKPTIPPKTGGIDQFDRSAPPGASSSSLRLHS